MKWVKGRSDGKHAFVRSQKWLARSEDIVIEELDDEILVYDSENKRAHCLGATAARVWRACDGKTDVRALSEALDLSVDTVNQALAELEASELLDTQGLEVVQAGSGNGDGMTRRQMTMRSAKVGGAALAAPLIYSIAVPSPAAAQTPTNRACALFTTDACGTSSGAGHIAGCCCCCQKTNCKVGGSTSMCASLPSCPDPTEKPKCSASCNNNCAPAGATSCCDFAGASSCGCAFSSLGGTVCPGAGCAPGCTPGAVNCGAGCCNPNTGAGCVPGATNCVPCCNGVPINTNTVTFACCVPGPTSTCPP